MTGSGARIRIRGNNSMSLSNAPLIIVDGVRVESSENSLGFDVGGQVNVAAQDFHFSVQITDYDNDVFGGPSVTFANFDVHVNEIVFL